MPAVSVIIPTLNRPELLKQAVASVQAQTFTDWELIVVRNSADPDTGRFLARASVADARIRVLTCLRPGAAAARNEGLRAAQGDVAFLDDDDWWLPEKLLRQLAWLRRHLECGWGYTFFMVSDEQMHAKRICGRPLRSFQELFRGYYVGPSSVMVRREALERVGAFNESARYAGVEDIDWFLRLAKVSAFGCVPEPLAVRRLHTDHTEARHARYLEHVIHVYQDMELCGQREVTALMRRRKVARLHHDAALFYRERSAWLQAARHFSSSLRWYPAIGLYRAPGSPHGMSAVRELLRPWRDLGRCLLQGMRGAKA